MAFRFTDPPKYGPDTLNNHAVTIATMFELYLCPKIILHNIGTTEVCNLQLIKTKSNPSIYPNSEFLECIYPLKKSQAVKRGYR